MSLLATTETRAPSISRLARTGLRRLPPLSPRRLTWSA
jgi:hypothetical protein